MNQHELEQTDNLFTANQTTLENEEPEVEKLNDLPATEGEQVKGGIRRIESRKIIGPATEGDLSVKEDEQWSAGLC